MPKNLTCSSHTISGVMPGGPLASRHPFRQRVEAAAAAGYTGMCLHFRDYAEQRQAGHSDAKLASILRDNGMADLSVEFFTDWFMEGEAGVAARASEDIAIAAALAYGATSINVGSDFLGRRIPFEQLRRKFVELCGRAAVHGLSIAFEIVAWSDVRDVPTALRLTEGIDNAGLVVDTWHIFRGGVPLGDLAMIPPEKVLCIQVNDGAREILQPPSLDTQHRRLCGTGVFDLSGFLAGLGSAGVDLPLSVEIISPEIAGLDLADACRKSFETTRAVFG
jgi:sugar phosphate isomerase/epimerase